jgi:hypothetical protein
MMIISHCPYTCRSPMLHAIREGEEKGNAGTKPDEIATQTTNEICELCFMREEEALSDRKVGRGGRGGYFDLAY